MMLSIVKYNLNILAQRNNSQYLSPWKNWNTLQQESFSNTMDYSTIERLGLHFQKVIYKVQQYTCNQY